MREWLKRAVLKAIHSHLQGCDQFAVFLIFNDLQTMGRSGMLWESVFRRVKGTKQALKRH
jgi:hypothetical protein